MTTTPKAAKPRHTPGAAILVRFADGPMVDNHMTVAANQQGEPPRQLQIGTTPPGPLFSPGLGEPEVVPMLPGVLYHLVGPLDTVPWSYLYAIHPEDLTPGAVTA